MRDDVRTIPGLGIALGLDLSLFTADDRIQVLPYSAAVTPDSNLGTYMTLAATDTSAFTINAPLNPIRGRRIVFDIKNSSGGTHGTITWNASFLNGGSGTVGAGAFVTIANGKRRTISFYFDGTNWIELYRTADQ